MRQACVRSTRKGGIVSEEPSQHSAGITFNATSPARATSNLAGYGTLLESRSIDPLGNATKQRSDAAGRTLRSLDQLYNATVFTHDASGNQLSVRDPNNVGADMVYDQLGRNTSRADTQGDVTSTYQNFHSTCELDFDERKDHDLDERKDHEFVFPLAPVLRGEGQG